MDINSIIDQVRSQFQGNQFLSGGLVLGVATGALYYLKSIPVTIWTRIRRKLLFEVTIDQNDDLFPWVQAWVNENYKDQLRSVKATYWKVFEDPTNPQPISETNVHSGSSKKTNNKRNQIVYNQFGEYFNIWFKGRLIRISSQREQNNNAQIMDLFIFEKYFISGLGAKLVIHELLENIIKWNKDRENNKYMPKIYSSGYNWRVERGSRFRNIDTIFLNDDKKRQIVSDIKKFIDSKEFYWNKNIPYRRGYLFHGPPGTGKSSLVSALAGYFNRNLFVMNLKSYSSDNEFEKAIGEVDPGCFLLIEDIDRYYSGDKSETKINYSTFINEISGVKSREDIILIVTTNHKNKLDEALMRAGRLDIHIDICNPTSVEANKFVSWFFNKEVDIFTDPINCNMADIENVCIQNKDDMDAALNKLKFMINPVLNLEKAS